jgi:hypothetical protein
MPWEGGGGGGEGGREGGTYILSLTNSNISMNLTPSPSRLNSGDTVNAVTCPCHLIPFPSQMCAWWVGGGGGGGVRTTSDAEKWWLRCHCCWRCQDVCSKWTHGPRVKHGNDAKQDLAVCSSNHHHHQLTSKQPVPKKGQQSQRSGEESDTYLLLSPLYTPSFDQTQTLPR